MEFLFDQRVNHWHSFFFKLNVRNVNQLITKYKIRVDISFEKNKSTKIWVLQNYQWNILFEDFFYLNKEKANIKWHDPELASPYQNSATHSYQNLTEVNNMLCIKVNEYYQKLLKLMEE